MTTNHSSHSPFTLCLSVEPPTGPHGESVSATLAEDIEEQKQLEARISKAEAEQAELLERLTDMETELGILRPRCVCVCIGR